MWSKWAALRREPIQPTRISDVYVPKIRAICFTTEPSQRVPPVAWRGPVIFCLCFLNIFPDKRSKPDITVADWEVMSVSNYSVSQSVILEYL